MIIILYWKNKIHRKNQNAEIRILATDEHGETRNNIEEFIKLTIKQKVDIPDENP